MRFPLAASVRTNQHDFPAPDTITAEVGIFCADGFGASSARCGGITLPGDALILGQKIAALANEAYEQGKADAQEAVRDALGIRSNDDE